METIFRKVSVTDRLPEKGKTVFAINDDDDLCYGNIYDGYSDAGMEYFCTNDNETMEDITHWLEEIGLPSAEEIERCSCPDLEIDKGGWKRGAEWMRSLAVDAKMTCR